jgi:hypothetical protein
MLLDELPPLPAVSVLDGNVFESVFMNLVISLSGPKRKLRQSQRQFLSMFNRSSQRAMSRYLAEAQKKGFIVKVCRTNGIDPDSYVRGEFFSRDSEESRNLITLSNSLWGTHGLLRTFPYPSAWGHGCIPDAVILCLATLRQLDESISKKSLRKYLSALVPESSFNNALRFLKEHHLACGECERLMIAPDWEAKLRALMKGNSACDERQEKGDKRRRAESEKNRIRVSKGKLTDAELTELLSLQCVIKGCKRKARQQEHFPAQKYLKDFDVVTDRHLVWAICRQHNREMSDFIKKMPDVIPLISKRVYVAPSVNALRLYQASANHWIVRFYNAFKADDIEAASYAVRAALGHRTAVAKLPADQKNIEPKLRILRKAVGRRHYSPGRSQLSSRAEEELEKNHFQINLEEPK